MFESMSQVDSVRDFGMCPVCVPECVVRPVECEAGHSDCFTVECSNDMVCNFWESNCYGGE